MRERVSGILNSLFSIQHGRVVQRRFCRLSAAAAMGCGEFGAAETTLKNGSKWLRRNGEWRITNGECRSARSRISRGGDGVLQPRGQGGFALQADDAVDKLAVLEQQERGDAVDAEVGTD